MVFTIISFFFLHSTKVGFLGDIDLLKPVKDRKILVEHRKILPEAIFLYILK